MAGDAQHQFVFYDPSGRRWRRFRRSLQTFVLFFAIAVVVFILAAFSSPQLPQLGIPEVEHLVAFNEVPAIIKGEKPVKNVPFHFSRKELRKDVKYVRGNNPMIHPKTAATASGSKPVVFGYYVNWDQASIVSLRINLQHLTHLVPEWLVLQNAKGDIDDQSDQIVINMAAATKLPIIAMLTNYRDGWQGNDVRKIIHNPALRADLINNIESNLKEHKFAGVNIDFEQIQASDRDAMVTFMTELRATLKQNGQILTQSVPVDDEAYDLKRLAAVDDFIVPMVYDEHYQSGTPGPVASQSWFDDQIDKLSKVLPPEKTVIGFGAYGYDWVIGSRGGAEVGFNDVVAGALQAKQHVDWDSDTENPVLRYTAEGDQHEVWFLDAITALNEVNTVNEYGMRGVAVWRLGAEDPGLWSVLKVETWPGDQFDPVQLWPLRAKRAAPNHYGKGEVLRIAYTPHDGSRNVWRNPDGDYAEDYHQYPTNWVVEHTGYAPGKIAALSFDDGPDEHYTPEILDILKRYGVHASFFVVGVNAERTPYLIQREYREGHEIGNHTYSHPNIATTSEERTRMELTATQRIIENALGVSTTLFRPPYNADSEPQTPDELVPIDRAQNMGYVTIAETIDPRDWQRNTTVESILDDVKAEATEGNIILLHDGGGDRRATVEALPQLIEYLRSQGYQFTTISRLMNKDRAQTMPVPSEEEMRWAHIEGRAFDAKSNFEKAIGILFLIAIYLTLLRSVAYGIMAVLQKRQAKRRKFDPDFCPPVTVVIAAYNEEKVIERTVRSILDNGYSQLEIIVVNDGSKDRTAEVLENAFGENPHVKIFTQPNGGKSAALNNAIGHASNEILIAVDADTIFRRGTIQALVRHFSDETVGAVSGNARVGNKNKWITRFQSIEYIYGFNLDRRALDLLNAITVVPGAVGAWRKSLIEAAGGFGHDTLAEDTDLTLAIRRAGYRIRYEEAGIAYTEAPEDTKSLAKQRFRWAFGTLQAAWKHRDAMFDPEYGSLGWVALPSIWLFQVVLSALSPFAEIAMIIAMFAGNWAVVLLYYFAFFILEFLTGCLAYYLEREKPWDLALLFFQRIYYRQLMHYVLVKSLIYAMRGRLVGWGKLERRATVTT